MFRPTPPHTASAVSREIAPRFAKTFDADYFAEKKHCAALMPEQPSDSIAYLGRPRS